jgi:homoserine dehydrogenase
MSSPLRLGIAGLGTVGAGVVKIVTRRADLLKARAGREIVITAVSARDRAKDRGVSLDGFAWEDDPVALARRADVDVVVELMGGADGPAKAAVEAAIAAGKDVVTANKAMLALHGQALALAAEARGHVIRFEAAVAGGIPVVKALTEGLAGNEVRRVMGVMNGTCNYILTRMEGAGLPYEEVFEEARAWAISRRTRRSTWAGSTRRTSSRSSPPSPSGRRSISARCRSRGSSGSRSRTSTALPTWASASSSSASRSGRAAGSNAG